LDIEFASAPGDGVPGPRDIGISLGELIPLVLVVSLGVGWGHYRGGFGWITGRKAHWNAVSGPQMNGGGSGDQRGASPHAADEHAVSAGIEASQPSRRGGRSRDFALRQLRSLAAHGGYPVRPGYRARRRPVLPGV
jgi:hypothetical protein